MPPMRGREAAWNPKASTSDRAPVLVGTRVPYGEFLDVVSSDGVRAVGLSPHLAGSIGPARPSSTRAVSRSDAKHHRQGLDGVACRSAATGAPAPARGRWGPVPMAAHSECCQAVITATEHHRSRVIHGYAERPLRVKPRPF
jgi:hypothetical protein